LPRQAAATIQNNFSKGLITEATGLNFPENAVTDSYNCVFDERGRVRRRLGIDFEASHSTQAANRANVVVNSYFWKSAAGNGDNSLVVLQVGATLYFYKVDDGTVSDDMIDTIDLTGFSPSGAPAPGTDECQFTSGNGFLFVAHPHLESFYCEYDGATSVTGTAITLQIRDFEGVEDGMELDERPTVNTDEHHYNLFNQGWYADEIEASGTSSAVQVMDYFESERSEYPSNVDVWWTYRRASDLAYAPAIKTKEFGLTPAPKGHYLLNPYEQDRSTVSGVPNIDVVSSDDERASTIAFFAGRVWYGGTAGQYWSNKIYFSQIIETDRQFGSCYQQNDPTAEDRFDLLPSDGGSISIQEAGAILKLWPIENSLLVFASNGIWGISGSEGVGFRANDYAVRKLSSIQTLSASSFTDIDGYPAWWTNEGIYIAAVDQVGTISVQSMTDKTIKTLYQTIPAANKNFAKGYYNPRTKVVQWVYRTASYSGLTQAYTFDSVLNFNTISAAFYPWTVDSDPVSINGIVVVGSSSAEETTKYISSYSNAGSYAFTFSQEKDAAYLDWFTRDSTGVSFDSYFTSGYAVHGDAQRKFQPTYLYLFNETNSEENVLDFYSKWNYSTSGDTGRWSSTQRLTFPNDDYSYQFKRIKTRGHGLALQFHVASVTGEPFRLVGWSVFETQNSAV